MGAPSAFDIVESAPLRWKPGEKEVAISFVAITFYIFLDINVCLFRVFRKKNGLYFWSILLGSWGCLIDRIAVILRYFVPHSQPLWPLYTLFVLLGWTIYAPAQLLVLYSRLHLINQSLTVRRVVLAMIITVATLMIIPTWPLVWHGWNPYNHRESLLYSPREAIMERCQQISYTTVEVIISGIYIHSLHHHLKIKPDVVQKQVLLDLVTVLFIGFVLDAITVAMVFFNHTGMNHAIQAFSYILKLKLEFVVLNQLKNLFAPNRLRHSVRRYHNPDAFGVFQVTETEKEKVNKTKRWGLEVWSKEGKGEDAGVKESVVPVPPDEAKVRLPAKVNLKKRAVRDEFGDWLDDDIEEVEVEVKENRRDGSV